MKRNYDFFGDKENITNEDIEDFEAHANMMQERYKRYGGECRAEYNQSLHK